LNRLSAEISTHTCEDVARLERRLPKVGSVVGERYRLTRVIGAGGMGTVFEAESLSVGRRCAIKFLRSELAGRSRSTSRFELEAQTLARLEHEHVTAVFDYGWFEDETPFFVMEYLGGETLRQVLERSGPLPIGLALEVMKQACRGMAHAHERGIIHRDLKPDNLMLSQHSDGRPWLKILDFGVARYLARSSVRLTPTGAELGTAHYMSPEQARGVSEVDASADVYALGAVLYESLSGRRVHSGASYNEVLFNAITRAHVPLADICSACPGAVSDVVERCLLKESSARFRDGGELLAALERVELLGASQARPELAFAAGTPIPPAPSLKVRRWAPRRVAAQLAWPVLSVVMGVLVGSLAARTGEREQPVPIPALATRAQSALDASIAAPTPASSKPSPVATPVPSSRAAAAPAATPVPSSLTTTEPRKVSRKRDSHARKAASNQQPSAGRERLPETLRVESSRAPSKEQPPVEDDARWPSLPFSTQNPYAAP
jgi:serine/threonine-protein kinase